jgi:hypothetical protein
LLAAVANACTFRANFVFVIGRLVLNEFRLVSRLLNLFLVITFFVLARLLTTDCPKTFKDAV